MNETHDEVYARSMFPTPALWEAYCRGELDALERVRAELRQEAREAGQSTVRAVWAEGLMYAAGIVGAAIARARAKGEA